MVAFPSGWFKLTGRKTPITKEELATLKRQIAASRAQTEQDSKVDSDVMRREFTIL